MKSPAVCVLTLSAMFFALAASSSAQLSTIGGFEENRPSYWNKGDEPPGVTLTWATDQFHSFGKSLKISKTTIADSTCWASWNMADNWAPYLLKNVDILLGAYVRTEGINTNPTNDDERWSITFLFYDDFDNPIRTTRLFLDQSVATTSGWIPLTNAPGETILPVDAKTLIIFFKAGEKATGTVWADDFTVCGRNGIWAGQGWNCGLFTPAGWYYWFPPVGGYDAQVTNGFENTSITTETAHSGTRSLKFVLPANREPHDGFVATVRMPYDDVGPDIHPGDSINVSVWIKASGLMPDSAAVYPTWSLGLTPQFFKAIGNNAGWDATGSEYQFSLPAGQTSFEWTKFTQGMRIPADYPGGMEIRLHIHARMAGTIYFDDLSAQKVPPGGVTFRVNMNKKLIQGGFRPDLGDQVFVRGSFNGWTLADSLSDADRDSVYTKTLPLSPGNIEYKFFKTLRASEDYEAVVGSGGPFGNRTYTVTSGPQTLPAVYFNNDSSSSLLISGSVTFSVNMGYYISRGLFHPGLDSVFVRGSFNSWAAVGRMSAADSVYAKTLTIQGGLNAWYPYKFCILRQGGGQEYEVQVGEPSGDNRSFQLIGDASLPVVYFNNAGWPTHPAAEIEPNDSAHQAMLISIGDSLAGAINPAGDVDYFKFIAAAGDTVRIYAQNLPASTLDGEIWLYDGPGNLLAYNNDFGSPAASSVVYTVTQTGMYFIRYACYGNGGVFPGTPGKTSLASTNRASSAQEATGQYSLHVSRYAPPVNLRVSPRLILQGAFTPASGPMTALLWSTGVLSAHFGSARVPSHAVDSITVEIRNAGTAGGSTVLLQNPAWLMNDGSIRDFVDTTRAFVTFAAPAGSYNLVVRHRNHLPAMSASPVSLTTAITVYDFTTGQSQAFGTNGMAALTGGVYGLYAGDANQTLIITAADANFLFGFMNQTGYLLGDTNLTGIVTAADANVLYGNLNQSSQVP